MQRLHDSIGRIVKKEVLEGVVESSPVYEDPVEVYGPREVGSAPLYIPLERKHVIIRTPKSVDDVLACGKNFKPGEKVKVVKTYFLKMCIDTSIMA